MNYTITYSDNLPDLVGGNELKVVLCGYCLYL